MKKIERILRKEVYAISNPCFEKVAKAIEQYVDKEKSKITEACEHALDMQDKAHEQYVKEQEQYVLKARIEELEKLRLPMNYDERPVVEYKNSDGFVQCDKNWSKRINKRIAYYKAELKKGLDNGKS